MIPALLERKKQMGPDDEKATIKTAYDKAVEALKKNPEDLKQYITLASVFLSEGRVTGNNAYYSNAAVQMLDKVNQTTTGNRDLVFQALSLKSAVLLNMHQFKDALATAQQAVKDCDRMMSIRPDLRSYSRASYLRQIFGQNNGAKEAMQMAVQAGLPGQESTEWARTNLADLYLNTGNLDSASILYRSSLVYRPDYPFALIGLARVEKAKKDYDAALGYTKKAIQARSEVAFVSLLADIYELKGDAEKAKQTRRDVIDLLQQGQDDEPKDATVKHNVSREMATAYLNAGDADKALQYASTDLSMRPDNIDANELIAWIYYMKHDYANAKIHTDKMLATKTQNAASLYKAGLVYVAAGDAVKGNQMMQDALVINPNAYQAAGNENRTLATVSH